MLLIVYRVFFLLERKTRLQNLLYLSTLSFKHWPDGMGAFKRHIDPEHDVHIKCIFDDDQLIFRLTGKSVSIDVSVNSLSNEKVLNNRKNILAIIDAIKLCGRLGIAL